MTTLYLDLETYSSVSVKVSGSYRYAEDPDREILLCAWALDAGPVEVIEGERETLDALEHLLLDPDVAKVSHNVGFDRVQLSAALGLPVGEYLDPAQWYDTAVRAAAAGYPRSLAKAAAALGCTPKDTAGTLLISRFCAPYRGKRVSPADLPEDWERFREYCRQDVETMREIDRALPGEYVGTDEHHLWVVDQRINDHGMRVDAELAEAGARTASDNAAAQRLEVERLAGIGNANSVQQLGGWLTDRVVPLPNLQAATVEAALTRPDLPEVVRRVLEIRQELSLASPKKYSSMMDRMNSDGRLRGAYRFHGAHTGRWAGSGVQPHNLPRASLASPQHTELARFDVVHSFGADAVELRALVRGMFDGPLSVVDYNAIEARVVAWLAGEEWALTAFRTGRPFYEEQAARMGPGRTRQEGKVASLALGYGGGVGALSVMAAAYGADLGGDDEKQKIVHAWRAANQAIVRLWADLERAFKHGGTAGRVSVTRDGEDRSILLPSGRTIEYHGVRMDRYRVTLTDAEGNEYDRPKHGLRYTDPVRGNRAPTWGGTLTENVTQAVARDVLAVALVELDRSGYPLVGHVHDEVIIDGVHDLDEVARIVCDLPAWAEGLPMAAKGFTCRRYRKD